jgi:hypothetical protein
MTLANQCPRCKERGKTWQGSDPKCAFPEGVFVDDNWNCATANALRDIAEIALDDPARKDVFALWDSDENLGAFCAGGFFVVLSWYKRRGQTGKILKLESDTMEPLTLEDAEKAISSWNAVSDTP